MRAASQDSAEVNTRLHDLTPAVVGQPLSGTELFSLTSHQRLCQDALWPGFHLLRMYCKVSDATLVDGTVLAIVAEAPVPGSKMARYRSNA